MAQKKLGFGLMRLPVLDDGQIDLEQVKRMADLFLENGFTYFDTSFVYHNGQSEHALRQAVVERYPRDRFTIATKFPTFSVRTQDQVEDIFARQLENLGTDYIDYYLLHTLNTKFYNGTDGKGGVLANRAAQALRYAASKDGVLTVLSGMSNMAQMEENVNTMRDFQTLTAAEEEKLLEDVQAQKENGPLCRSDFREYEALRYHGIPVASLLDGYNSCMVQPNPGFAGELNYLANELLKLGVTDLKQPFPEETVTLDGEDITPTVKEAWDFLIAHSFAL